MSETESTHASSENLVATYFRLGLAIPNSERLEADGFRACLGGIAHPICNFAISGPLDPWAARHLRRLAEGRETFRVFAPSQAFSSTTEEVLVRAEFAPIYRLVQMVAEPAAVQGGSRSRRAADGRERHEVARFMSDTFFSRQTRAFRQRMAEATTHSGLELRSLMDRAGRAAAVMLSREAGVLGLYNLCVASHRRGAGIGTRLVRECLAIGQEENLTVSLQCAPSLRGWYEALGFRTVGHLDAYSLSCRVDADIIKTASVL